MVSGGTVEDEMTWTMTGIDNYDMDRLDDNSIYCDPSVHWVEIPGSQEELAPDRKEYREALWFHTGDSGLFHSRERGKK